VLVVVAVDVEVGAVLVVVVVAPEDDVLVEVELGEEDVELVPLGSVTVVVVVDGDEVVVDVEVGSETGVVVSVDEVGVVTTGGGVVELPAVVVPAVVVPKDEELLPLVDELVGAVVPEEDVLIVDVVDVDVVVEDELDEDDDELLAGAHGLVVVPEGKPKLSALRGFHPRARS
jgi:hypothetical protein